MHKICALKWLFPALLVLLAMVPLCNALAKDAELKDKLHVDKDRPIEIVANRMDAYNEKKLVIFTGNAVATQGDRTIKADQLFVYYKKNSGDSDRARAKNVDQAGDLDKIEAKGHVMITQDGRLVTADNGVFYHDAQQIAVTGNAVMSEGGNVIRGEKIIVFLNENRGIVEGAANKRVTATIYPSEKNAIKK
jgi:lipopolysaccharide export system protein LptA